MSLTCLTCDNKLSEYEEDEETASDVKSAESCTLEFENDITKEKDFERFGKDSELYLKIQDELDHTFNFLYCKKCWSLHVYCKECKSFTQLVERSCQMDSYKDVVSWRDYKGKYHYTSVEREFALYDKNTYIKPPMSSSCFNGKKQEEILKTSDPKKLHDSIFNYIINDFPEKFRLDDLKLFCLDPNNERLISNGEKGLALYGKGFNVMERAFAKWRCEHGNVIVNGHR